MEDTKRPVFGAEAERIGTRLDEATDEFLKDGSLGLKPGKSMQILVRRAILEPFLGRQRSPLWPAAGDQELPGIADPTGSGSAHSHGVGSPEIMCSR